jgi:hypothetical protein
MMPTAVFPNKQQDHKSKRIPSIFNDKEPDHVYVLDHPYTCYTYCNLRFNLYCFSYSAIFCFLTVSMSVPTILVTRWPQRMAIVFFVSLLLPQSRSHRISSGQWPRCDVTYGCVTVPKIIRINKR